MARAEHHDEVEADLLAFVEAAIREQQDYIPDKTGEQYVTPLWELVRKLKSRPELREKTPKQAQRWMKRRLEELRMNWSAFVETDSPGAAAAEFRDAWGKVKFAAGESALTEAHRLATAHPLPLPIPNMGLGKYKRFEWLSPYLLDWWERRRSKSKK